ncbi:M16 family metallopeptidase [Formosa haliotis]|uniref:M16 family metallopeptidase n=1 Tax=Formosa haliotis TaxID=1555194 RepID=UPI00082669D3|nr:pitrilysin family protein [Formosa haliotis]
MSKNTLGLLFILFISAHTFGQKFFIPEGISYKKLPNGFSYYIIPKGEPGKIGLYLLSDTGSAVEKFDERGVAHFLEHMVFKGSKNFPGHKTAETLESMGLRMGRDYNAVVNDPFTEYHVNIPENNQETLDKTLRILYDWSCNLEMNPEDLEVEKNIVIEEIKMRKTGGTPFVIGTYLEGHNGLGSEEQIRQVTAKKVKDFYDKYYTPDQLALIVYGKVNEKQVSKQIESLFGKTPEQKNKPDEKYLDLSKNTIVNANYVNENKTILVLGFKTRDFPINNYESYKKDFINTVFCRMLDNRISQLPNSGLEKVDINPAVPLPGNLWYNFRLETKKDASYKTVLNSFTTVVAQARQYGFSQDEIDFFANALLKRYKNAANHSGNGHAKAKSHFLKGDVPISNPERVKYTEQVSSEISPKDFTDLLNSFTSLQKTILFDNKATACSTDFNEAYILEAIQHINKITVAPYQFVAPRNQFPTKNYTNVPNIRIGQKTPKLIKSKVQLGDYLHVLNYDNGTRVVVNTAPEAKTEIKIVSNYGLNSIPKADRGLYKATVNVFDQAYGQYSEKEALALKRSMGFLKL